MAEAISDHRAEVERYRRLLGRNPGSLRFAEFADHLRQAGKLSDATAICARGLAHHPHYATGHVVMGEIFRDAQFPDKAEREWREALRLDPTHPRAHVRLGELHLSRGDLDRAVAEAQAALLCSPGFAQAQTLLAEARKTSERGEDAAGADALAEWEPGKRPAWLTSECFEGLTEAVSGCRSVQSTALVNASGLLLDGSLPSRGRLQGGAGAAAELMIEARDLLRRLGAGRLRSVFICGAEGSLRCLALGDLTLAATLQPDVPIGAAAAEMEEAIAELGLAARRRTVARG